MSKLRVIISVFATLLCITALYLMLQQKAEVPTKAVSAVSSTAPVVPEALETPVIEEIPTPPSSALSATTVGAATLQRGPNNRLLLEPAKDLPRSVVAGSLSKEIILRARPGQLVGPLTIDQHTLTAIEADFDPAALKAFLASETGSLRLPLAAGRDVVVAVEKVITRGASTKTLIGKVDGHPLSDVLLVFHDGAIHGSVAFMETNTHYQFGMAGEGDIIAIRELNPETFTESCGDPGDTSADELATEGLGEFESAEESEPPAGATVIDIVVGYGREARLADGGVAGIESRIILSVDRMNTVFINSEINTPFVSLMAMIEDPDYVFPGDSAGKMGSDDELGDLRSTSDGSLDTVSQLRIDLGADQNTFVIKQTDGSAGVAYRPGNSMIVARTYMSSTRFTFCHELGHNLGCRHAWADGDDSDPTDKYNYGWRFDAPNAGQVRTVMSYDWSWPRIPHFSNPDVDYDGVATGVPNGYDATGDGTTDQRLVSGGIVGTAGDGYDGSNSSLGARNAQYINSFVSTLSTRDSREALAVLDPATGDIWEPGKSHTIYWYGGDHTDTVAIDLYMGNDFQFNIASGVSGENRWYPWTIPNNQADGNNYVIRVTLNSSSFVESSVFSIGTPPTVTIDSPTEPVIAIPSADLQLVLEATVVDGSGSGSPSVMWSQVSGPGTAIFKNASVADTTVSFSAVGVYQLQLLATQGGLTDSQELMITVGVPDPVSSLAIHYPFNEVSGSSAADSSGNGNDASISGSSSWTSGRRGNALLFTASPSYADSAADIAINNSTGFSASAWVRLDATATNNRHIMRQNATSGTARSWLYVTSSGILSSYIGGATTSGITIPLDEWHHVALTAGNGTIKLYVDGEEVGTSSGNVEACSGVIRLGQQASTASQFQWLGALDEARVHERVLTADEVARLMVYNVGASVNAGTIFSGLTGIDTVLAGNATDDGIPNPPATLSYQWSQVSGPGAAVFTDSTSLTSGITFPRSGFYVLRLVADDGEIQTADDVYWTVLDPSSAEQWRYSYFGAIENSGNAADDFDFDLDGLANLLERAFGTDPTDATSYVQPTTSMVDAAGNPGDDYFAISHPRLSGGTAPTGNDYTVDGITYTIEHSTDFAAPWDNSGFILLNVTTPVNGVETATFRLATPSISGAVRNFLHLKVTVSE